jgi:MoxR-like ATPase
MNDTKKYTLADSARLTHAAVDAVLSAPCPEAAEVDGKTLAFTAERSTGRLSVQVQWADGFARFAVTGGDGTVGRRSTPEDHDHRYSLRVHSDLGQREVSWVCMEWLVRDAIRAGETSFGVTFSNSFSMRDRDENGELRNAAYGARSREIAARSGLSGGKREPVGVFDLDRTAWSPSASETLRRLLVLCTIKVHFLDRGEGRLISGKPLFSISPDDAGTLAPTMPTPLARGSLGGVHPWPGGLRAQWEGVLESLEYIQEDSPLEVELETWIQDKYGLTRGRYTNVLARVAVHLGLAGVDQGRWQLTDLGLSLLESRDGISAFRAFAAAYTGFEETLAYVAAHPGARSDALHEHLNSVLGVDWASTAQAARRANWLVAFGLAESDRGSFRLTEQGEAVGRELQASVTAAARAAPATQEKTEEEIEPEGSPVLSAAQVDLPELLLPDGLLEQCCAALNAGKHLMLVGPPGTGKSTLGVALGQLAAEVYGLGSPLLATASADWTTYDTIGGWTQRSDQTLAFREGVVTRALKEKRWLVLDEVNRADIDKCFGELFTALAGGTVTTAYTHMDKGREVPVRIGPGESPYSLGPWFRIIATMNVRDKASLFRLSYAFVRRFAVVTVPGLGDAQLSELARRDGQGLELSTETVDIAVRAFSAEYGLSRFVPLGPSMLRDVLRYVAHRHRAAGPLQAVAEGFDLCVLPQLEGMEDGNVRDAHGVLGDLFAADPAAAKLLQARFSANYPHVFR